MSDQHLKQREILKNAHIISHASHMVPLLKDLSPSEISPINPILFSLIVIQ